MITDSLSNGIKELFAALGAKTSDSNYAVPLLNKTNGTPQGMMDMSSLASVLGVMKYVNDLRNTDVNTLTSKSAIYQFLSDNHCTNLPKPTFLGIMFSLKFGGSQWQITLSDDFKLYARDYGFSQSGWTEWAQLV